METLNVLDEIEWNYIKNIQKAIEEGLFENEENREAMITIMKEEGFER